MLRFEGLHAADSGADEHTGPVAVHGIEIEAGVTNGLRAGNDRELDEAIHALGVLAVDDSLGREVLHFTRESRVVLRRIEARDGLGTRPTFEERLPEHRYVVPERRNDTRSSDEYLVPVVRHDRSHGRR